MRMGVDTTVPPTPSGRKRWTTHNLDVRLLYVQIPGFRPFCLMTNLFENTITPRALALHYHQRWDIEVAYDEIKTHQCATLRGQMPTTFRSKMPPLVKQELYATLILYNAVRQLICLAVLPLQQDPRHVSFLDVLQHLIDATPSMSVQDSEAREASRVYLFEVLAECRLERPRRPRSHPRVVKVKMSKFRRKNPTHTSQKRDIEKELRIIDFDAMGVAA